MFHCVICQCKNKYVIFERDIYIFFKQLIIYIYIYISEQDIYLFFKQFNIYISLNKIYIFFLNNLIYIYISQIL